MPIKNFIPLVNLKAQNQGIRQELFSALEYVLDHSAFNNGPLLQTFEKRFAKFCGCSQAVGCASGSAALHLALLSLGLGPGDEVITTPFTFVATVEAIVHAGATPVFADIDPRTYTLNPIAVQNAVTPKTKAILAVHLYGHPCDLPGLQAIATRHRLFLIEDCAQAHGAAYQGKKVGSWGDAGCFSFYPSKNLGAWGEAGALVTNRAAVARKARSLANHGRREHQEHADVGYNFRMDGLQAALLGVKLRHLAAWNQTRQRVAAAYRANLENIPDLVLPCVAEGARHAYHLFVIQSPDRDRLRKRLKRAGIASAVHYALPVHLQPAYRFLGFGLGDFPVSEGLAKTVLSLPFYPEIPLADITAVTDVIRQA
jgi:dTDP-4-amino-4,6-dideoxygalactose transaminase